MKAKHFFSASLKYCCYIIQLVSANSDLKPHCNKIMPKHFANSAAITAIKALKYLLITSLAAFMLSLLFAGQVNAKDYSQRDILNELKKLSPLQKVHYSWPLAKEFISPRNPIAYEYARLTHAISLRAENISEKDLYSAVRICNKVNKTKPAKPCSIAVNYSPWHRHFKKDLPPTDFGKTHKKEIDSYVESITHVKHMLAKANKTTGAEIKLTAILLDSENFRIAKGNEIRWRAYVLKRYGTVFADTKEWNDAINKKHRVIYEKSKQLFPETKVIHYDRGAWFPAATSSGWMEAERYTLEEPGDVFSVSLYRIVELADTRESFTRTFNNAKKHNEDEVVPWVALASGLKRDPEKFNVWTGNWDYDLVYSWQIGAEINNPHYSKKPNKYAPWNAAKDVVFFPTPFHPKKPAWPKHFIAYVRGANGITELP
ncbi:MAG: hypothetical protein D6B28_04320 [Gammaproteobacteria bacterium]|nr:MAG: hypothetical protein D6B28_04320 [Gammaproteobacteria bacterium]